MGRPAAPIPKTETAFKNQIRPFLNALPRTWIVKVQQVGISGTPDFLLCVSGHFVALELKRHDKAHITKLQRYELTKIEKAGGYAFVVHPGNWSEIYGYLERLAWGQGIEPTEDGTDND